MAKDFIMIFEAAIEEEGSVALEEFTEKWYKRYPHVSASLKKTRLRLRPFSSFLRRLGL